eukprot:IDg11924t1
MIVRSSTSGTRRGTRILEGCVLRTSSRYGRRQIEVFQTASSSISNSMIENEAVCAVCTAVHARVVFNECTLAKCA